MHAIRHALRALAHSPAYTAIALFTLALGIGVNTSMFSLVNTLLFRSAPYPKSEQVVQLATVTRNGEQRAFSEQEIREIRDQARDFSALTALAFDSVAWTEPGQPAERINMVRFTSEMNDVFQVPPLLGRGLLPEDFEAGKGHAVVLNEWFWRTRFNSDPQIVGRTLRLAGESVTIVGVMPARFDYKLLWGNTPVFGPIQFTPDQLAFRAYRNFLLIGRLKPGATERGIGVQLAPLATRQEKEFPQEYPGIHYRAISLQRAVMNDISRSISWTLLGLASFILLIACANLANLQLARATASLREFAIRAALGASRRRLIVQQLTEAVLLSGTGGALGFLVAYWINDLLEQNILLGGTPGLDLRLDWPVIVVAAVVSLVTGVLFGIVPAVLASRADLNTALKSQSRGSTASRRQQRLRHALIIGEIAIALVLLGGAAVMNRGLVKMLARPVGWDTSRIATGSLPLPESRYPSPAKRIELYDKLLARLQTIPGVEHAALATSLPLFGYGPDRPVFSNTIGGAERTDCPTASHAMVTPDYFATMGITLLQGKIFGADVHADSPQQIVVNRSLADRFWPGENPIGKRLGAVDNKKTEWREVIGVVGDVEPAINIENPPTRLTVYRPLPQEAWGYVNVVLRGANPATLTEPMRRAIADIDADLSADQVGTVREIAKRAHHNLTVIAQTMEGFAFLGLALAAVGLYGVISSIVVQRTGEFGVRLALGATPHALLGDVLGRGLRLAAFGLVIGVIGAWGLTRFLASIMPRLASADPGTFVAISLLLLAVTLVACWFPARRATKVAPMIALRTE